MSSECEDWGCGGHHVRHGSYEEYDHSDQEIYVYDQCCANCRFFCGSEYGSECVRLEAESSIILPMTAAAGVNTGRAKVAGIERICCRE